MLDLKFFKGSGWQSTETLDYTLYTKESSQWIPLSLSSNHPWFVHSHWPYAMIRRIFARCKSKTKQKLEVLLFRQRYWERKGLVLASCRTSTRAGSRDQKHNPSRLVLPWGSEVAKVMPKTMRRPNAIWGPVLLHEGHQLPKDEIISISWSLGGRHLVQNLLSLNRRGKFLFLGNDEFLKM